MLGDIYQKGLGYLLETVNKEICTQEKALGKLSKDVWIKKHYKTRLTFRSVGCVCRVTKDCSSFHGRENMRFFLQSKQTQSICRFEESVSADQTQLLAGHSGFLQISWAISLSPASYYCHFIPCFLMLGPVVPLPFPTLTTLLQVPLPD